MSEVLPVILCGGGGTRLWPISRESLPKQFHRFGATHSLLQLAAFRALAIRSVSELCVVCAARQEFLVARHLRTTGAHQVRYVLEPSARDTGPAIAAAAWAAKDENPVLVVMPSDHYLPDVTKFTACIHDAVEVARHGYIVTLGIQPRHAATEYGYIEVDAASSPSLPCGALVAARFTEKPNRSFAEQFTASGKHLWNAGIFVASARLIWDTVQRLAPDLAKSVEDAADSASSPKRVLLNKERYETARKISFDYAVMERSDRVAVLPYSGEWSDLGTWDAVAEYQSSSTNAHRKDQNKNIASVQSDNNFVLSQKLVATLGVSDLVVVDTDDVLMVAKRGQAELMRQLTAAVHLTNPRLLSDGSIGERPWGYYRQLARGDGYQVKLIEVEAGQRLSLQSHRHRSEHWIVVNGIATVQVGDATLTLRQGQHVFIPQGTRHRLANQQTVVLRLLEVQVGTYLEEDDIVRYQDDYGRVSGEGET